MGHHRNYYRRLIFDPNVTFNGQIFKMPTFGENSLFLQLDLQGALQPAILPIVFCVSDDRSI